MSSFIDANASLWADITPLLQDDGPSPVVVIDYDPQFVALMNIFRGLIHMKEFSGRGLIMSQELLNVNAASYTVWQYRRACLKATNADLNRELDFMDTFAADNPKNYQIWQHRRAIVEQLGDGSREKDFCESIFVVDAKNYHAWAHLQWVVKAFSLWEGELEFVEECLEEDIRNNSAWNHRWYIVHNNPTAPFEAAILQRELAFTFAALQRVTKNESAWNYLRGICNHHAECVEQVIGWCKEFVSNPQHRNYLAIGLLADLSESLRSYESTSEAIDLFQELETLDAIRCKSWQQRKAQAVEALKMMALQ